MQTMLFNPYTGKPRDPRDIASDPFGTLMIDPDAPLRAASPVVAQPVADERGWKWRDNPVAWYTLYKDGTRQILGYTKPTLADLAHELGKQAEDAVCRPLIYGDDARAALYTAAPALDADVKDAERWRKLIMHVGGEFVPNLGQVFEIRGIRPLIGANIMKGGVAQHFTEAIDAALNASKGKT